jgi:acyl carrier protein
MQDSLPSINQSLCNFISENLVASGVGVLPETPFETLGLDSFSIIEIILYVERKYDLTLPDEALTKTNIYSVSTLADCIHKYLSDKSTK